MVVQLISRLPLSRSGVSVALLRSRARQLLRLCDRADHALGVVLVDDAEMRNFNRDYRHRDSPTNVLAFPGPSGGELPAVISGETPQLGDIIISIDTARREAVEQGQSLHERLTVLMIHGLVHLLGLDHERSEREALLMEAREKELRQQLQENRRGKMAHLAVNVDHVATVREARGIAEPDPVQAAGICELAGAAGIVVHLREDRRHIQDRDVQLLRQTVKTRLNLEMATAPEIIDIALAVRPNMVTLVPEKRQELSTEGGLDVIGNRRKVEETIQRMTDASIPVSLFVDPDMDQIDASRDAGATFVEIHTGRYCEAPPGEERDREFTSIAQCAEHAFEQGLRVNAGHGLDYRTTRRIAALDTIEELSIGHAIISRAVYVGLERAVREMLDIIRHSRDFPG